MRFALWEEKEGLEAFDYYTQDRAPVLEALERFKSRRVVPFDVPGHKRGRGNAELVDFLGEKSLTVDVNSMKMLYNLCHPVSVRCSTTFAIPYR